MFGVLNCLIRELVEGDCPEGHFMPLCFFGVIRSSQHRRCEARFISCWLSSQTRVFKYSIGLTKPGCETGLTKPG